jgi:cell division transport system permease protein
MRLGLVLGEAASGLRRNISMVISVILVTFISLTFVGAAILLQSQIGQMKGYWYDRAQVAVFLCTPTDSTGNCVGEEATQEQIDAVQAQLQSDTLAPFIKKFEFETHDQAYTNFESQYGDSSIAEFVTPDLLPQSFRVNLVDPTQAEVLTESLSGLEGVQSVDDQRHYLDQIFSVLNTASFAAVGLAGLMLVAAVLLIATTIRLSAFSRRRELGIMRLVGASNRFIQTPFILEGIFASLIGSVLAGGAVVAIVQYFVQGYLRDSLAATATVSLVGLDDAIIVVPILIVIGGVLAAASAGFAINRYLKV